MKKINSNKSFIESRNRAIGLTVVGFVLFCLLATWENIDIMKSTRVLVIIAWYLIIPALVIYSWIICVLNYVESDPMKEKRKNPSECICLFINMGIMILFGIGVGFLMLDMVKYIATNWKLLEELYTCLLIKMGIMVGWIICFWGSVKASSIGSLKSNRIKAIVLLMLAMISLVGICILTEDYVSYETELAWVRRMTEYYEEHEMNPNTVPFSQKYVR